MRVLPLVFKDYREKIWLLFQSKLSRVPRHRFFLLIMENKNQHHNPNQGHHVVDACFKFKRGQSILEYIDPEDENNILRTRVPRFPPEMLQDPEIRRRLESPDGLTFKLKLSDL